MLMVLRQPTLLQSLSNGALPAVCTDAIQTRPKILNQTVQLTLIRIENHIERTVLPGVERCYMTLNTSSERVMLFVLTHTFSTSLKCLT